MRFDYKPQMMKEFAGRMEAATGQKYTEKDIVKLLHSIYELIRFMNEVIEDFEDYVRTNVPNPAMLCGNWSSNCVDCRGWCIPKNCVGFEYDQKRLVEEKT